MQKEILKSTGEDVETLYLAYINSGQLNSSVKVGQRRSNSKPTSEINAKLLLAASSTAFLTGATCERL